MAVDDLDGSLEEKVNDTILRQLMSNCNHEIIEVYKTFLTVLPLSGLSHNALSNILPPSPDFLNDQSKVKSGDQQSESAYVEFWTKFYKLSTNNRNDR